MDLLFISFQEWIITIIYIYRRVWSILDCTVTGSGLELFYTYAKFSVVNTTFVDMFKPKASSTFNCVRITSGKMNTVRNILFHNTSNGPGSLPFLIPTRSNVTISGAVTLLADPPPPSSSGPGLPVESLLGDPNEREISSPLVRRRKRNMGDVARLLHKLTYFFFLCIEHKGLTPPVHQQVIKLCPVLRKGQSAVYTCCYSLASYCYE